MQESEGLRRAEALILLLQPSCRRRRRRRLRPAAGYQTPHRVHQLSCLEAMQMHIMVGSCIQFMTFALFGCPDLAHARYDCAGRDSKGSFRPDQRQQEGDPNTGFQGGGMPSIYGDGDPRSSDGHAMPGPVLLNGSSRQLLQLLLDRESCTASLAVNLW